MNLNAQEHIWENCINLLKQEINSTELSMWVYPLQAKINGQELSLFAPNEFVVESISKHLLHKIQSIVNHLSNSTITVSLNVGSIDKKFIAEKKTKTSNATNSSLFPYYSFNNFVQGKSNQLAKAAAYQVAENPGKAYNPLLLYGSTGLGKTHLLHATGNLINKQFPEKRIAYFHSEQFVRSMIDALRHNTIDQFKKRYRQLEVMLIDDIQFFAGKERSQEEFFHTFNTLLEGQQQIILTCDRYPKEVDGIEDRLKSRFGWGLSVSIEPPDFETRVAILLSKASQFKSTISEEVAYYIAKRVRSNVRELEGCLKTLIANAKFTKQEVSIPFAREILRDIFATHERNISIDNIKKAVADYYNINIKELDLKKRTRAIARPRQIAMTLAKELTEHSLPEIGKSFGGRDHTTVLHAHRKITELCQTCKQLEEDKERILKSLGL